MTTVAQGDEDKAEQLARRRALYARLLALLLLLTAGNQIMLDHGIEALWPNGSPFGFACVLLIALFVLASNGGLNGGTIMRARLNDESTIEHSRRAYALGFWVALVTAGAFWVAALRMPIGAAETAQGVVSLSIAVALLRFATLEMRAMKE
jgi:hypothetical protein